MRRTKEQPTANIGKTPPTAPLTRGERRAVLIAVAVLVAVIAVGATAWAVLNHPSLCAALTIIVWDALVTIAILKFLGVFIKLRASDDVLEEGDIAVHQEDAYPDEALVGGRTATAKD